MNEQPDSDAASDDLSEYDDLVSALRSPGLAEELLQEQVFLSAYRESRPEPALVVSLPRRLARRLGAGGTAVVVAAVVGTGGVAAAVTGNLPDPVQEIAHSVLGAPAPQTPSPLQEPAPEIAPETSEPAQPSPSSPPASSSPTPSSEGPAKEREGRSPKPTPEPSQEPAVASPTPEPQPEPTPVAPVPVKQVPASVSIAAGAHTVPYSGVLMVSGVLVDAGGSPVADRVAVLQVRVGAGWRPVARVRSDEAGAVAAPTAPVTELSRYRWQTRPGVRSLPWRVRVQASLSASYAVEGGRTRVTAVAVGGTRGDAVNFYVRARKSLTLLGVAQLGADGAATVSLPTPQRNRIVVLRLVRTADHTGARAKVLVIPPEAD